MAIPLSYNFRNLVERRTTTIMTALGIALTVAVMLGILGMLAGLRASFQATGHPLHLLVLRKGSTAELTSVVTQENLQVIRSKEGVQVENGEPMISQELVTVVNLKIRNSAEEAQANVNVRGLPQAGVHMRAETVKLSSGRWFAAGQRELTVGRGVAQTYEGIDIGKQIQIGRGYWTIVGVFDGGQTAFNGEIWTDGNQLANDVGRPNALSSALLRAADPAAARTLAAAIANDQRLSHEAVPELDYYLRQTESGRPLQYLGIFVAVVMAIGSSFAAMNTMYAAVVRRSREIGVLRVLGFSRPSILLSFMIESFLLSVLGGVVACLITLPFNGVSSRIGNQVTFSQTLFQFRVTPAMLAVGLTFAAIMGLFGGLLPARTAARKDVVNALRDL